MRKRREGKKYKPIRQKFSLKLMWRQRYLLFMSLPFLVWLFIFKYIPLWGWTMAFQEVRPKSFALSIWERDFVGLKHFEKFFNDKTAMQVLANTIGTSIIGIVLGVVCAIMFALLLNEVRQMRFKKLTQTLSYLPHFVSWVIIASIAKLFLGDSGVINELLGNIGINPIPFMTSNSPGFWVTVCVVNVWKEMGWDAIIYLSAMAAIDPGLYEAAKVDGAGRFKRMWHVTLPGIRPTIIVLLIMSIGGMLNVAMERQMLLSNGIVKDHAMVLTWYSYVKGIGTQNYGFGTAMGVFQSVLSVLMLFLANKLAGMFGEGKLV